MWVHICTFHYMRDIKTAELIVENLVQTTFR
jgi:hypothetical protein